VSGESASVTAGALGSAAPGYRGATMAMHSTLGFTGSFFGPPALALLRPKPLPGDRGHVAGDGPESPEAGPG